MSTFPTPLIPATQRRPILPAPFRAVPDGLGGWFVDTPAGRAGHAFPRRVHLPGDAWFGKRTGTPAQLRADEPSALAHVVGCDPEDVTFEEEL